MTIYYIFLGIFIVISFITGIVITKREAKTKVIENDYIQEEVKDKPIITEIISTEEETFEKEVINNSLLENKTLELDAVDVDEYKNDYERREEPVLISSVLLEEILEDAEEEVI